MFDLNFFHMFIHLFKDLINVILDEVDLVVGDLMVPGVKFLQQVDKRCTKHKPELEHADDIESSMGEEAEEEVINLENVEMEDMREKDRDKDEGEKDAVKSKKDKWVCMYLHLSTASALNG